LATVNILGATAFIGASAGNVSTSTTAAVGFYEANVNGQFAFSFKGADADGGFFATGAFTADGNGNVLNGVEDLNDGAGVFSNQAFSGTYSVGTDGRGTASLNTGDVLKFVIDSTGNGAVIQFNDFAIG